MSRFPDMEALPVEARLAFTQLLTEMAEMRAVMDALMPVVVAHGIEHASDACIICDAFRKVSGE